MSPKTLKLTINLVFLSISIFLSTYFMIQLTENPYIRFGIAVFAIGLEAAMQYVLALGKHHFRRQEITKKLTALILFVCYAAYIFIYNIPSAVGFFVMEIDVREQAAAKVELADKTYQQKLEQISRTINILNNQLEAEAATGYGKRSQAIMDQLEKLHREQERLQTKTDVTTVTPVTKNVFRSLEGVLRVPANILKIVIFGTSILMLCIILIITSWDLPDEETVTSVTQVVTHVTQEPETVTPETEAVLQDVTPEPEIVTSETVEPLQDVTLPVTQTTETVTSDKSSGKCVVCGETARPGNKYCSGRCRTTAYRARKVAKKTKDWD